MDEVNLVNSVTRTGLPDLGWNIYQQVAAILFFVRAVLHELGSLISALRNLRRRWVGNGARKKAVDKLA